MTMGENVQAVNKRIGRHLPGARTITQITPTHAAASSATNQYDPPKSRNRLVSASGKGGGGRRDVFNRPAILFWMNCGTIGSTRMKLPIPITAHRAKRRGRSSATNAVRYST